MGFLDYDVETRKITCSTNAIESINAPYRRAPHSLLPPSDRPTDRRIATVLVTSNTRLASGLMNRWA